MRQLFAEVKASDFDVPKTTLNQGSFNTVFQIVLGLAAAVALIILLLASLKYITSRGEPAEVAKAKNTIIYAIIGLVIVAAAFSIVTFVARNV